MQMRTCSRKGFAQVTWRQQPHCSQTPACNRQGQMHLAADGPSQLATATAKRLKNATVRSSCGCQRDASPSAARVRHVRRLGGQARGSLAGTSACAQGVGPHKRGLRRWRRVQRPHRDAGPAVQTAWVLVIKSRGRLLSRAAADHVGRRCWLPSSAVAWSQDAGGQIRGAIASLRCWSLSRI